MEITIFKDIKETSQPFYRQAILILQRIKDGASKELVKRIREEKDKDKVNSLKQKLPAVCFSGNFTKRNDKSLNQHSGLICLDFDGYPSNRDLLQEKERLSKNKYVYSVFISPSGKGLKAIIKIPPIADNHKSYFNSLENKFFLVSNILSSNIFHDLSSLKLIIFLDILVLIFTFLIALNKFEISLKG